MHLYTLKLYNLLFRNCEWSFTKCGLFKFLAKKLDLMTFMQQKMNFNVYVTEQLMANSSIALIKLIVRLDFSKL